MSKSNPQPALRHISEDLVNRMLKLQQLFHQRYLTADLLNQLVAVYVQAIQCFDGTYSPMRKYFLSRIQFVVSQPEIDNMLKRNAQGNNMVDVLRQTVRMTAEKGKNQEHISHQMLMEAIQAQNKKYKKLHEKNVNASKGKVNSTQPSNNFYIQSPDKSLSQTQSMKAPQYKKAVHHDKKIEMSMNLMRQVSQNIKNFENEDKKLHIQTKRINALMKQQNNTLQARLAMRKKGKNRKKSIDEKFFQQVQQIMPMIQKQELRTAQKQIQQAVERMTARLTQRQGTNKGSTGLIISTNSGQQQKYRGRIKIKNEVKQIDEDDEDLLAADNQNKKQDNPQKGLQIKHQQNGIQKQKAVDQVKVQSRTSDNGTGRFTLGGESGGRGRIKRRDTTRMDEDDEQLI